ncbi:MAG TPA: hypothetical protein VMY34_05480 [Acidimicrobiales bacterium]|nr:hypothetical protein [Acidimicrobiales bacterium]
MVSTTIHPTPTDEELAAIMAAIEVTTARVVVVADEPGGAPPWRFSGRWWRRPVAARRERPW